MRLSKRPDSTGEYLETSWRQQSTALAILNDLGVATAARAFSIDLTATGGIDRSITRN